MVNETSLAMRYDTYTKHKHKETWLNIWTVGMLIFGILLLLLLTD